MLRLFSPSLSPPALSTSRPLPLSFLPLPPLPRPPPLPQFGSKELSHRRRYTRWFRGASPAVDMTSYAMSHWRRWRSEIQRWQLPVLRDPDLPDWFKSALFNELYFIAGESCALYEFET